MATTNHPIHPALAAAYAAVDADLETYRRIVGRYPAWFVAESDRIDSLRDELAAVGSPRPVHGRPSDRTRLVVDESRSESAPCQAGTVGCCVDHDATDHGCEGW